jgi:DNA-binding MarR family transcriptional regulator
MSSTDLPEEVRWLITNHVASVLELDVLLAMRDKEEATTPGDLARELRSNETVTEGSLDKFAAAGLLVREADGYVFRPATPRLTRAAQALADTYARRRVSVVTFIYGRPSEGVSAFANAFRFRKGR